MRRLQDGETRARRRRASPTGTTTTRTDSDDGAHERGREPVAFDLHDDDDLPEVREVQLEPDLEPKPTAHSPGKIIRDAAAIGHRRLQQAAQPLGGGKPSSIRIEGGRHFPGAIVLGRLCPEMRLIGALIDILDRQPASNVDHARRKSLCAGLADQAGGFSDRLRARFPAIATQMKVQPVKAQPAFAGNARQTMPEGRRRHAKAASRLVGWTQTQQHRLGRAACRQLADQILKLFW